MTRARAMRLSRYARCAGYEAEVVANHPKYFKPGQPPIAVVRVKRPGQLWGWCLNVREWVRTIRYYRRLDAEEPRP